MFKLIILLFISIFLLTGCGNQDINNNTANNNTQVNRTNTESETTNNTTNTIEPPVQEVEVSTFTTKIYTKEEGRQNNMRITTSKLNGAVIYSGETFSFCDTVGKATTAEGYMEADIFDSNGNKKKGLGGGNCQVSSTLYNAVLAVPELEVIERHPHSNKVPYIETGKDAAVAYGSADFKFKNNLGYNIKIYTELTADNVTIRLVKI